MENETIAVKSVFTPVLPSLASPLNARAGAGGSAHRANSREFPALM